MTNCAPPKAFNGTPKTSLLETGRWGRQRQHILGLCWTSQSHKCVKVTVPHMTELPSMGETAPLRRHGGGGRGRRGGNAPPPRHCWGKKTCMKSENERKKIYGRTMVVVKEGVDGEWTTTMSEGSYKPNCRTNMEVRGEWGAWLDRETTSFFLSLSLSLFLFLFPTIF